MFGGKLVSYDEGKVKGMAPGGAAPGMEMGEPEVYTLYLFDASGARDFGKWLGDKPA